MAELTPMMQQYYAVKERNPDCLLFFRLGDFYEMFEEDARIASRELDLTLTSRDHAKDKSAEDKIPMCGVPYHSSESYIARLVAKGYKVAICEQMEDPALAKGLVKRDIIRIVTPGSVTESSMLVESKNNYYACVYGAAGTYGLCFCDVSTGAFSATQVSGADAMQDAQNELGSFLPSEALLGGTAAEDGALADFLMRQGVDALICGGIGAGAQRALQECGIRLYGGAMGNADDAVAALLNGTLAYNPAVQCSHHGAHHECGEHGCKEHEEAHACGSHACGGHDSGK